MRGLGEWRGVLALLGGILLLVAAHYAFLYRPLVDELRHTHKPKVDRFEDHPLIEPDLVRQLGWLVPSRESERARSFQRVDPVKRSGVQRVCCFGGSTTFGTEVEGGHGYPTRLQQLLDERARAEVEVVNFGIPGYGFHQTFRSGSTSSSASAATTRCSSPDLS